MFDVEGVLFLMYVFVLVISFCLCLKEILVYGVYNQCLYISIEVELVEELFIEDLILMVEKSVFCEVYGFLKCLDEKYVIECVYDNLKFVEDLVWDVVLVLNQDWCVVVYVVEVENFEFIYNYFVFVCIVKLCLVWCLVIFVFVVIG